MVIEGYIIDLNLEFQTRTLQGLEMGEKIRIFKLLFQNFDIFFDALLFLVKIPSIIAEVFPL